MKLTQKYLKQILHYDPETGIFTWNARPVYKATLRTDRIWNTRYAGKVAGSVINGYIRITITINKRPKYIVAHRLAWLYMTGSMPPRDIDHKNLLTTDNSFSNLRPATRSQNNANSNPPRDNKSGKKGVCWDATRQKWRVDICKDGVRHSLGRYDSFEDACAIRTAAAKAMFGEFFRGS